ncbi:MAG: apolipoprotein N-acyltransferase [Candidatus Omnitrophota bacterium]
MLRQKPIKENLLKPLLAVTSGVLGFLAFPPFNYSVLAWVFLVPLLFVIKRSDERMSFLWSYLSGVVFFGCLLYWLVNVSILGMVILVLALAFFFGFFGLVARIILKYAADIFILPFFWVALEYIRGHIFTGFPWGLLAYSQYQNINLIQIADFTGAYGVSFLIVMFNMAAFGYLVRVERKLGYMMMALFFILVSSMYGTYRLENYKIWGSPRMSVIQGNIPQQLKWDPAYAKDIINEYSVLTREASKDDPSMIIWPETAYPHLIYNEETGAKEIRELAAETGVPILTGAVYDNGKGYFNDAILYSEKGEFTKRYDKLHLVPFGEYVPLGDKLSFVRKYIDKPIGDFKRGREYTLFPMKSFSSSNMADGAIKRRTNFYKFGVLVCFEDIFPELAREYVRRGANFLVVMTNDAWFGRTAAPEQHLQASVFRAVENRAPVVRAANTGVSCFVDSDGRIRSRVMKGARDTFVEGYATDNVKVSATRTPYTIYGDTFVYFCGFMLIILIITEALLYKTRPSYLIKKGKYHEE